MAWTLPLAKIYTQPGSHVGLGDTIYQIICQKEVHN